MPSDKAYAVEQRLNALVNQLGLGENPQTDGVTYGLGMQSYRNTGTQLVNSATPAPLTGLQGNVGAGSYAAEAWVWFTGDSATYLGYLFWGGTATCSTMRAWLSVNSNASSMTLKEQDTFNSDSSPAAVDFALASGTIYQGILRGSFTFSAPGTFGVYGATSGGDGYTTFIRNVLRIWPTT